MSEGYVLVVSPDPNLRPATMSYEDFLLLQEDARRGNPKRWGDPKESEGATLTPLEQFAEALLALLKAQEWSADNESPCPICGVSKGTNHLPGCELAAMIEATKRLRETLG